MAQSSPPARILVGFAPGGLTDAMARRLSDRLRESYAPVVVVENRPGAGGQIAVTALRQSVADGSSLLLTPSIVFSVYPSTYPKLPYRTEELTPLAMVCSFHLGLAVGPSVPGSVKTLKDFLAWCKGDPSRAIFGSPAAGSTTHLVGEQLTRESGVALTHVAYKGNAPGLQDLLGGQIPAFVTPVGDLIAYEKAGKVRVLAVSGAERNTYFPNVPTFREQGLPIVAEDWYGLFLPGGVSASVLQRASAAVKTSLAHPDMIALFTQYGMTSQFSLPEVARERLQADSAKWGAFVKKIGFTAES